jgi:hypothetical protein
MGKSRCNRVLIQSRKEGRPKRRWKDDVNEAWNMGDLKETGMSKQCEEQRQL